MSLNTGSVVLPKPWVQDIDTEEDRAIAELKHRRESGKTSG